MSVRKCISDCYTIGTIQKHPITGETITSNEYNFCAVDSHDASGNRILIDKCHVNVITPIFAFGISNNIDFLKWVYGINNLQEFYEYIRHNKNIPIYSKNRLANIFLAEWLSFFNPNTYDSGLLDSALIEMIIDIFRELNPEYFYVRLRQYFCIKNGEVHVVNPSSDGNVVHTADDILLIIKYINTTFFTYENVMSFIDKFFSINSKSKLLFGMNHLAIFVYDEILDIIRGYI